MPDFQLAPALSDLYTSVLSTLKDKDTALAKMDYAGWTNLPTGAIRSNAASSYKLERWNGTAWVLLDFHTTIDNHIANTAIHSAPNVGAMEFIAYDTADSGWLLCDGGSYSTSTYPTLFAKIGYAYGGTGGSFNVPNLTGRLPIGLDSGVLALNARGKTAGSWDHTHTISTHQHTIADHNHGMRNHTHTGGSHTHTAPQHTHDIPSHYHWATANGGTINIQSSGSHTHDYLAYEGGSLGTTGDRPAGSTVATGVTYSTTSTGSGHIHASDKIVGTVGQYATGVSGDVDFTSLSAVWAGGSNATGFSGAVATTGPNLNTTDGSGTLTTDSGGGGSTAGANPPVLVGRWQIKF
jgi:microcystin-dependent protein